MTRKEIDKNFILYYEELLKVARDMVGRKRVNYKPEAVLTDAYLELIDKSDKLKKSEDVERFVKQFIKLEVNLTNSKTNRTNRVKGVDIEPVDAERIMGVEDWKDYDEKVVDYTLGTEAGVVAELYKARKENAIHGHVFELYLDGVSTCRELAKKLSISKDSAARQLARMKEDVKEFTLALNCNQLNK